MANKITKAEREALYQRADELLRQGLSQQQVTQALQDTGISRDRARHAAAVAQMRGRGRARKARSGG